MTDDGGATVTTRGVCWSTSQNPTTSNSKTTDGSGTGSFTSSLTGLTCGTTYYVRAYATNSAGTAYGSQENFNTELCTANNPPVADFSANPTSITEGQSVQFTDLSINTPTSWSWNFGDGNTSTTQNPSHTYSTAGSYTVTLTATNSYGSDSETKAGYITVTAAGITVTDYDGNVYPTVTIGSQVWMAGNLKTTHYADGSAIPLVEGSTAWDALGYSDKAYCWYDNSTTNRDEYGGLYTWAAAMNGAASSTANPSGVQGACPDGWHLPSDEEWAQLTDFLGGQSVAGGKMKETGTLHWNSPNTGATNESGFTALPGGYRDSGGAFYSIGGYGYWWSSSEGDAYNAWYRGLYCNFADVGRGNYYKNVGFSVRCVRDE